MIPRHNGNGNGSGNGHDGESPRRILIADDDPLMRTLLTSTVTSWGFEATAVPDGCAAVQAIQMAPPDVVLADINMPGLDGFALCELLKGDPRTRLIPVVLITGLGDEHKAAGIEAGADDFLSKPVSLGDLRVRLRSLLRMKAFTDDLESAETVLRSLAISIEAKDPSTEGHCERLAHHAVQLGKRLGMLPAVLHALRLGGYLHDLGKVSVPEAILLKAGPLTPEERYIMQTHPVVGERICRPLHSIQAVLPIIRHHHERWDGSGYPDGLVGEAIPLAARILAAVDVLDALTTDRPYRRALPLEAALGVVTAETAKGWWDPTVISALQGLVATGGWIRPGAVPAPGPTDASRPAAGLDAPALCLTTAP